MKTKSKFILSLILLETALIILTILLSGVIEKSSGGIRILYLVMTSLLPLGAVLIAVKFTMIKAVHLISDYILQSFDIRKTNNEEYRDTGFKFINTLVNALHENRKRTREILLDVKRTTGQNYLLGDKLSDHTISSLHQVKNITDSIDTVSGDISVLDRGIITSTGSVNEIFKNIKELSRQIDQQTESLENASSAVEEMTSSSDSIARITRNRKEATSLLVNLTRSGEDKLKVTGTMIEDISMRTGDILQMITLINDIASRTNLLAINASIEAAHAGDSGKGFAVVANEIRQLAENTAQNANNISDVLQEIASRITNAREASTHTEVAFREITAKVKEVSEGLNEVTAGMDELVLGEKEILRSTSDLLSSSNTIKTVSHEIKEKTASIESTMENIRTISSQTNSRISRVRESTVLLNSLFMESSTLVSQNLINMETLSRSTGQFEIEGKTNEKVDIGVKWTGKLSVKDKTVDAQHQELFKNINDFLKAIISGTAEEKMGDIIKTLNDYVVYHFDEEERFMEKYKYPELKKHHQIHQGYIKGLVELTDEYNRDGISPALMAKIQKDIALGLIRHIYNDDMLYKEYFETHDIQR